MSGLRAVSAYREPLRACIHALKYNGNTRLAEPLGQLLVRAYTSYGLHADIILPVPLHSERQRQRGYNHASLLARVCSTQLGVPLYENILIKMLLVHFTVPLHLQPVRSADVESLSLVIVDIMFHLGHNSRDGNVYLCAKWVIPACREHRRLDPKYSDS
jgi:hypothetical protein